MTVSPGRPTDWQQERRWLGYAGLVPFVACLGVMLLSGDAAWIDWAADALRHYAAVIASFLGAVHWGLTAEGPAHLRRARLRWGVVPALVAWLLLASPQAVAFAGFALLFLVILVVDHRLMPALDHAYRALRVRLSVIVIAVLGAAALGAPTA